MLKKKKAKIRFFFLAKLDSHFLSEKRKKQTNKQSFTIYFMKMIWKKIPALKWKFVLTEIGFSGRVLLIKEEEVASYPQALKAFQNWNPFISP